MSELLTPDEHERVKMGIAHRPLISLVIVGLAQGCVQLGAHQSDGATPADASSPSDAGNEPDASVALDASMEIDASVAMDAGREMDASFDLDASMLPDASTDAGLVDAGPLDAGPLDAGLLDAGPLDAGPLDAGPLDAGPLDAGPPIIVACSISPSESTTPACATLNFALTCMYSDGSSQNVGSDAVVWTSTNESVVTIAPSGRPDETGAGGTATVTATLINGEGMAITASAQVTVGTPTIVSCAISPRDSSLSTGSTLQFTVSCTDSCGNSADDTPSATWESSNSGVATISSTGLATGVAAGSATISASVSSVDVSATLTVTPSATGVSIAPNIVSLFQGNTQQLALTENFSDGSTQPVTTGITWSLAFASFASISTSGLLTGLSPGVSTITASVDGFTTLGQVSVWFGTFSPASGTLAVGKGLFSSELKALNLLDGSVFWAGGASGMDANNGPTSLVDVFDGTSVSTAATMKTAHTMGCSVALSDGGALVAGGGLPARVAETTAAADRYDPVTQIWAAVGSMNTPRQVCTATLLTDGRVLVTGGEDNTGTISDTAEVFDPSTNAFTYTTMPMSVARGGHQAALLPNGNVIIMGGSSGPGIRPPQASEVYNFDATTTGSFSAGPDMVAANREAFNIATLPDGRILLPGGCVPGMPICGVGVVSTAEIYDPVANKFAATAPLPEAVFAFSLVPLPNGKVLLAGGNNGSGEVTNAEVFDPTTETWNVVNPLASGRFDAGGALSSNGQMVVGGGRSGVITPTANFIFLDSVEAFVSGVPTMCEVCNHDGTCVTLAAGTTCDDSNPNTTGDVCDGAGNCAGH